MYSKGLKGQIMYQGAELMFQCMWIIRIKAQKMKRKYFLGIGNCDTELFPGAGSGIICFVSGSPAKMKETDK